MKRVYYKKLLLMYSGVYLVFTMFFFSIFIAMLQKSESEKQIQQNKVLLLDYVKEQEEKYALLISTAEKVSGYDSLASFALSGGNSYYQHMFLLKNELKNFLNIGPQIMIHKYGDLTCITNIQSTKIPIQLDSYGITQEKYNEILTDFSRSDLSNKKFVMTDIGLFYIITHTFGNTRMVIATFDYLWDTTRDYGEGSIASFSFLDDRIEDLRSHKSEAEMREFLLPLTLEKNSITIQKINGEIYFITRSLYNNTAYYLKGATEGPNVFQATVSFLPYMIGTFILSLFSIYLLSKKIYKPIGELVDTLIDVKDEGNSSEAKNEIEYLAKQVSRIRYENQDLAQTVRENLVSGKKRFLTSLFHGTYNTEMLKSDLEKYDLNWLEEVNYIVRMDVVDSEGASVETVPPNLIDIVSRHIATSFVVESVYIYSGQNYFIIHTEDLEEVEMVLSRAAATIDTVFGLAVTFYLGKPSKSVSNLNYSLMTIEKVFDASSSQIPRCIYDFGDIKNLHKVPAIYPIAIEQKLLASIESNNQGAMDQILTYIFKEYGGAFEDVATRNMLTYALANTINRCAQRLSVEVSEVYGQDAESVYQILSACQNESLLKERTYALIHDILEEGGSIREKQDHTKKEQIEKYVKDNLRNEISLITMADYFQLTPNYMSSIFKEAMNVNFKDYTSRIRFEVSLECLVQTTDISMIELAEKIGLNNTTTLLRLFKKYANCTPSSYLKKIKQI